MKNFNLEYDVFEGMTSISSIINSGKRKIFKVLYNTDKKKSKYNELKFLESKSCELGFELEGVPHSVIDELVIGKTHGGFVALCNKQDITRLLSADRKSVV